MENNQNLTQEQLQNLPQGWSDVQLSADMPLVALVQFLNVLNQRLCELENTVVAATDANGNQLTYTQLYREQAFQEFNKLQEQLTEQEEEEERSQFAQEFTESVE